MKKSTLTEADWFFYKVLPSKHCPCKDIRTLKYDYTLPEFLKLEEYVLMMEDMEKAVEKDDKLKHKE